MSEAEAGGWGWLGGGDGAGEIGGGGDGAANCNRSTTVFPLEVTNKLSTDEKFSALVFFIKDTTSAGYSLLSH